MSNDCGFPSTQAVPTISYLSDPVTADRIPYLRQARRVSTSASEFF